MIVKMNAVLKCIQLAGFRSYHGIRFPGPLVVGWGHVSGSAH